MTASPTRLPSLNTQTVKPMTTLVGLARNALILGFGTASAQLLGVAAMPLLARIYNPADFGMFAIFFLGSQALGNNLAARYEQAIILADKREVAAVATLCFSLAIVLGPVIALGMVLTGPMLDRTIHVAIGPAWPLLGLSSMLVSIAVTLEMLAARQQLYSVTSVGRFTKIAVMLVLQGLFGLTILPNVWGLIVGEIIAIMISIVALVFGLRRSLRLGQAQGYKRRRHEVQAVAAKYSDYPKINLPHSLINSVVAWAIMGVVVATFNVSDAGNYFMMYRVVMLPAGFLGIAIAQVYYRDAAEAMRLHGRFDRLTIKVIGMQGVIGVLFAVILGLFGEDLFRIVLGPQWSLAGRLASVFAPYVAVHLVLSTLAAVPNITNNLRWAFVLSVLQNVIYVGAFWVGTKRSGDITGAVAMVTHVSVPYMLAIVGWYVVVSRGRDR
jgi:O-antigen/teichoic acid export membrane protein